MNLAKFLLASAFCICSISFIAPSVGEVGGNDRSSAYEDRKVDVDADEPLDQMLTDNEATDDEAGVMVEATFTSIADVVGTMRWGWLPVGPLITQRFDSVDKVARIGSPLLVVHGSDDRLIPAELGRRLYDAAREPKRWVLVEGGTHHNTQALAMAEYRRALRDFFELRSLAQASAP